MLLARHADVNRSDNQHCTVLLHSIHNIGKKGNPDEDCKLVELLLATGANPNLAGKSNITNPLYIACSLGLKRVVELLLQYGADPNGNAYEDAPLLIAVQHGHLDIAITLLRKGANPNLAKAITTVLQHVVEFICQDTSRNIDQGYKLLELLLEKGANTNVDQDKITPLHKVCCAGLKSIAELLLKFGANIHDNTDEQYNLLDCTAFGGKMQPPLLQLLLEYGAVIPEHIIYILPQDKNYKTNNQLISVALALDEFFEGALALELLHGIAAECGPAFVINRLASKLQFILKDPEALVYKVALIEYAFKAIYSLYKDLSLEQKELIHCDQSIITQYALEHNVDLETLFGEAIGEDFLSFLGIGPVALVANDAQDEAIRDLAGEAAD